MVILSTWPRIVDPFCQGAHSGLDFHYGAGIVRKDNAVFKVEAGYVTLEDDATSYIWVTEAGVVSADAVGYAIKSIPLYTVTTVDGEITEVSDDRSFFSVGGSGGSEWVAAVDVWPGFLAFPTPTLTAYTLPE